MGHVYTEAYLEVLRELVSQPTAPFHEERIAAKIVSFLKKWQIPFEIDDFGNIIAHYRRGEAFQPLVLMAHMDHPGLTILEAGGPDGADFTARLEGGVTAKHFEHEVAVKLFPQSRATSEPGLAAQIVGYKQGEKPREIIFFLKLSQPEMAPLVQPGDFGIWDLPDFEVRDNFVHARVIDDLVGCAAALLTLEKLAEEQSDTDVYGVFTRAEEVGLVGAEAILSSGVLPSDAYIVSLEASKTLPGAVQGEGPVIRVGDRLFTFCEEAELVLKVAAQSLSTSNGDSSVEDFKFQRQLMSGGGCEAGAALLQGYLATGLAFPLGNYHNMTDSFKLEPENIHVRDFVNGVLLLQEAARLTSRLPLFRQAQHEAYSSNKALTDRLRNSVARIQNASQT